MISTPASFAAGTQFALDLEEMKFAHLEKHNHGGPVAEKLAANLRANAAACARDEDALAADCMDEHVRGDLVGHPVEEVLDRDAADAADVDPARGDLVERGNDAVIAGDLLLRQIIDDLTDLAGSGEGREKEKGRGT